VGVYKGKRVSADSVKKRVSIAGLEVYIDRPKGFVMTGKDSKGIPWERKYQYDYGFLPKTLGGDDDGLDVFIGPDKAAANAYWAIQHKDDGSFDEYKVFLGFPSKEAAKAAYVAHIPKSKLGGFITMGVDMMRAMLGVNPTGQKKVAMVASLLDELEKISAVRSAL
jgi:hypothetical protein